MVRSRSDIYTRPLPLYIPSEVTWFHGEIPRLKHPLSSLPPLLPLLLLFIMLSVLLSSVPYSFYLSQPLHFCLPLLFSLFYLLFLALYHSISPFRII